MRRTSGFLNFCWAGLAISMGFLLVRTVAAQAPTATLVGLVTDSSKAAIVGANIAVRNTSTAETRTSRTNGSGEYSITTLTPGVYNVTISMPGFQELRETRLELQVAQTARLDATLKPGTATESVSVSADVGLLNTETPSKGGVITPIEIAEIPLNGRDFNDLAFTVAGVQPAEQGGKGSPFVTNGSRADSTNFFIDGLNDENARDAGAQIQPPLDSLQEFKMETSNYGAQYGMGSGGVVNLQLKSGGNRVHGALFEFVRNDAFDARNHFDLPGTKSELRRNQFGGTLGGPVVLPHLYNGHDRTFFLVSWESLLQVSGSPSISTVPTAAERSGDFSQSVIAKGSLKNPFTTGSCASDQGTGKSKGLFPGNVINLTQCPIDPVAARILAYLPLPNYTGSGGNFYTNDRSSDDWTNILAKVDQKLSAKDHFAARYLRRGETSTNPYSGSPIATFGAATTNIETLIGLSETRIFSSRVVNNLVGGMIRTVDGEIANDAGQNYASQLGIPGTTNDPALQDFPKFTFTGYATLGDSSSNPITYVQNKFDYNDVLTWTFGKHTLALGGDLLHTQYFQPTNSNFNGSFTFKGTTTGNAIAELLLGIPSTATLKTGTVNNHLLDSNYSAFVTDDYKALQNLTLTLGLRYEVQTPPTEEQGQFSSYIPSIGKVILSSANSVPNLAAITAAAGDSAYIGLASDYNLPPSLIHTNYGGVSPRVGFALRPLNNDRLVLRGGYGLFYTGTRLSAIRTDLAGQFPFSISSTVAVPKGSFIPLSNPFNPALLKFSGTTNANGFDPNPPLTSLQSYNLTVERDLGKGIALEVGYVGSKGTHLGNKININQVQNAGVNNVAYPTCTGAHTPTCSFRPYPFFGSINYYSFNGPSSYNAAMVTLRRNFKNGIFFRVNYTYGKSLDEASGFNYAGDGGYQGLQNSLNPSAEYGRSDFDVRHNFSATFVYRLLPNSRNVFIHGWQLAGSGTAYSGAPFTPQLSGPNGDQGQGTRPDRVCNGTLPHPTQNEWFDLSCFPTNPDTYVYGNSGRNILSGPNFVALNVSLGRQFKIRDYGTLEFRSEIFNVTNHTNLDLPNDQMDTPTAGTIISASDPRVIQFGGTFRF